MPERLGGKMKIMKWAWITLVFVLVLSIGSCSTAETFNIVGTWTGGMQYDFSDEFQDGTFTFSGDESSGTVHLALSVMSLDGTYSVNGLNVTLILVWNVAYPATMTAIGTVSDDFSTINGTFTQTNDENGTWNASR